MRYRRIGGVYRSFDRGKTGRCSCDHCIHLGSLFNNGCGELRQPSSRGRGSPGCNLIVPRLRRRGNHDDGNSHSENRLSFFISLRNIVYALMTSFEKNFLSSSRNIFIFLSLKFHLYLVQTSIRDSLLLLLLENERALSRLHRV